jgi:hypothetical protein
VQTHYAEGGKLRVNPPQDKASQKTIPIQAVN